MASQLLNLPQYRVLSVEEGDHDFHIDIEPVERNPACPACHSTHLYGHGAGEQPRLIKDLPIRGKRVGLYVEARRFRCRDCQKTFMETLPALAGDRWMTQRLAHWIGEQSLKRPFLTIAEETGVDEKTVRNVFNAYVDELEKEFQFTTPTRMGIDEIHIIKRPRAVISNIQANTIVNMLADRNKKTVATFLSLLPDRDRVQYVAIDMWAPYRDAVYAVLPQARVVVDKFHVLKMGNEAMEKTRKAMREELSQKARRGLMHDRFVLLKRRHTLSDEEFLLLDGWIKNYPLLGEAYRLKEDYFGIYDATTPTEAVERFRQWLISIPSELHEHWQPVLTAWRNWQPEIVEYFNHGITNAFAESLNALVRGVERAGRGYSWEALRAKVLFTRSLHKHVQPRPKFEKRRERPKAANDVEMGYGIPPPQERVQRVAEPDAGYGNQQNEGTPLPNYGVDVSTLLAEIEAGNL